MTKEEMIEDVNEVYGAFASEFLAFEDELKEHEEKRDEIVKFIKDAK